MNIVEARQRSPHRGSRIRSDNYYGFGGGLNLSDPPLTIPPGFVLGALNYEPFQTGGYRRVDGYEAFDGRLSPEAFAYWRLPYSGKVGSDPVSGTVITGQQSGATAVVQSVTTTSPTAYINLATWAEDSRSTTYTRTNLGAVSDPTLNPWGRRSIRHVASSSGEHKFVKPVVTTQKDMGFVVWLKAGTTSRAVVRVSDGTALADFEINLSDLTVGMTGGLSVSQFELQVQDSGQAWYKLVVRASTLLNVSQWEVTVFVANGTGSTSYAAAGESLYYGGLLAVASLASTTFLPTDNQITGSGAGNAYLAVVAGTFLPGEMLRIAGVDWARCAGFAVDARTSGDALSYGSDRWYPAAGSRVVGVTSGASAEVVINNPVTPLNYNQVLYSDDFDATGWTSTNVTVADVVQAIDPSFTQWQRLTATGTNGEHRVSRTLASSGAGAVAAFAAVKKGGSGGVVLIVGPASNLVRVFLDPDSGRVYHAETTGTAAIRGITVVEESADTVVLCVQANLPAGSRTINLALVQKDTTAFSYAGTGETVDCCGLWCVDGGSSTAGYYRTTTAADGDGYGVLTVINQQGEFIYGEQLTIAGTAYAESLDETGAINGGDYPTNRDDLIAAAIELRRDQIVKPTGIGATRAVMIYGDRVYCVRDQADGTAKLFRATAAGWSEISLGWQLEVDAQSSEALQAGVTLTGATSGASGTVSRVVSLGGSIPGGTGKAIVVMSALTGTFSDNEDVQVSAVTVAKANGASFRQQLLAAGVYEHRVYNFSGATDRLSLYFTNGVNRAVEFCDDGDIAVMIKTGMVDDRPTSLFVHADHLVLIFRGGSVQTSGTAEPLNWSPIFGASELSLGEDAVGAMEDYGSPESGDATLIFCRNSVRVLYGKVRENFGLRRLGRDTGALRGTMQRIGPGIFLDDRGFKLTSTTDAYGNFKDDSISTKIESRVRELRQLAQCSVISREYSLYRIFFSDGSGLCCGFAGNKPTGWMPIRYKSKVYAAVSGEVNGAEHFYWSDFDGNVYRGDFGTSFNGETINAYCRPSYNNCRTPRQEKQFREAAFEIEPNGPMSLKVFVDYDYAAPGSSFQNAEEMDTIGAGGIWGSAVWGEFIYGAGLIPDTVMPLEGSGRNIGFLFSHDAKGEKSHTIHGVTLQYSGRRLNRDRKGSS